MLYVNASTCTPQQRCRSQPRILLHSTSRWGSASQRRRPEASTNTALPITASAPMDERCHAQPRVPPHPSLRVRDSRSAHLCLRSDGPVRAVSPSPDSQAAADPQTGARVSWAPTHRRGETSTPSGSRVLEGVTDCQQATAKCISSSSLRVTTAAPYDRVGQVQGRTLVGGRVKGGVCGPCAAGVPPPARAARAAAKRPAPQSAASPAPAALHAAANAESAPNAATSKVSRQWSQGKMLLEGHPTAHAAC